MQDKDQEVQREVLNYDLCVVKMQDTAQSLNQKRERISLFIEGLSEIIRQLFCDSENNNNDVVIEQIDIKDTSYAIVIQSLAQVMIVINSNENKTLWFGNNVSDIPDNIVTQFLKTLPEIVKRLDDNYPDFRKHYLAYINLV